jgi:hypothetical protein
MPPVANRTTDIEIPRAVWSAWKESGKPRQLRRPLTWIEARALENRRDELAPAVAPYDAREADRVALALTDMYGGYPSMGSRGDQSVAGRVEAVRRAVAAFPCWAIEKACHSIHANGVWRDGAYDRKWPPTDAEIVDAVREAARLYTDSYQSAVNLLEAEVEDDFVPSNLRGRAAE